MVSLLGHLEENRGKVLARRITHMNEFKDEDLAKYPAIEIREQHFSAEEFENIANNIIIDLNRTATDSADKPKLARALGALAYNTLMDPGDRKRSDTARPLFHKDELKLTEHRLRICAKSDFDLKDHLVNATDSPENPPILELIRSDASDFERKASIGAWAYYHLRMMSRRRPCIRGGEISKHVSRTIRQLYGFDVAYRFPDLRLADKRLKDGWIINKSGETLYLLYRSMIIVESSVLDHNAPQKQLLRRLAFDGQDGLFDGCLWLWTWFRSAACATPKIPLDRLFDEFKSVFDQLDHEDPGYNKFTSMSRRNLSILRDFHDKYIEKITYNLMKSKYFRYARLVNKQYFRFMRVGSNKELIGALMYIYERKSGKQVSYKPEDKPWERWGDEMGAKMCQNFENSVLPGRGMVNRFNRVVSINGPSRNDEPTQSPDSSDPECSICRTSYRARKQAGAKIVMTKCGHMFCESCITVSIRELGERCPKCRTAVQQNDFIEVFEF